MSDPVKKAPVIPAQRTAPKEEFFLSEGVRAEIEAMGEAIDPATGRKITKDDLK